MNLLYVVLAAGLYQTTLALLLNATGGKTSTLLGVKILFKVIPFFGGLATIAYCAKTLGWL